MTTRAKYRDQLPQLDGGLFLTDGGLETTLIFHEGWDWPFRSARQRPRAEGAPRLFRPLRADGD